MVDEKTGRVVDAEHKGGGYELTKGKYVEIDEDELKAIQIESAHTLNIDGFVSRADIDKRYLDKPYYIAPNGKTGAEAFVVIRDAMQKRVALARVVMAHREHIIMLEPLGKGLLGTTLRFDYEVRSEKEYFSHIPSPRISKDMVSLASHILESKATRFDAEKFKDEYETALRKLVQRKAKGHAVEAPEPEEKPNNVDQPDGRAARKPENKIRSASPLRYEPEETPIQSSPPEGSLNLARRYSNTPRTGLMGCGLVSRLQSHWRLHSSRNIFGVEDLRLGRSPCGRLFLGSLPASLLHLAAVEAHSGSSPNGKRRTMRISNR